jgi:hypothetical protein
MKRRRNTALEIVVEKCECGENVELDNPIVRGDENDMTKLCGRCDKCGEDIEIDLNDYEPDRD